MVQGGECQGLSLTGSSSVHVRTAWCSVRVRPDSCEEPAATGTRNKQEVGGTVSGAGDRHWGLAVLLPTSECP